jgi:3-hydroxymyristoyl/3-hydroxydecanoyl-(acyl carrier protein) dehydratase
MRRTAKGEWWTPLPGVELAEQTDGDATITRAAGSHIGAPVTLGDELRIGAEGRFLWLGRSADMQKIGGKRASLSALNLWITAIDGVDDAVYFAPDAKDVAAVHDDAQPARRLAAFYVSATLSPADVRAALRARVDPVFLPRPLFRVTRLPRDGNGKLSHAVLAALFSQSQQAASGSTQPLLVVPDNHPSLAGHFPGAPIVPGVVILSLVLKAIGHQLPNIVLDTLLSMRFHTPLRPGQPLMVQVEQRGERVRVEARAVDEQSGSGPVIATGQWAIMAAPRVAERP